MLNLKPYLYKTNRTFSLNLKLLTILLLFTVAIPSAYAIDISQSIKVVVTFEFDGNINQINGVYNSNFEPGRALALDKFGNDNFQGFTWDREPLREVITDMGINPDTGNHQYQIYPKQWFTGSTEMSASEYYFEHDKVVGETRQQLINMLQQTDAYNVETHLHYSWGSVDLIELF